MALEIEHKYLVNSDKYKSLATKVINIRQGYLSRHTDCTIRIRIANDKAFLTIKGRNSGDTRNEFEYALPMDEALELLALCLPRVISKTRHIVPYMGNKWEVDEFHGHLEGLTIAEIELSSSEQHYEKPPFAGNNVTDDPKYYNSNLSQIDN